VATPHTTRTTTSSGREGPRGRPEGPAIKAPQGELAVRSAGGNTLVLACALLLAEHNRKDSFLVTKAPRSPAAGYIAFRQFRPYCECLRTWRDPPSGGMATEARQ